MNIFLKLAVTAGVIGALASAIYDLGFRAGREASLLRETKAAENLKLQIATLERESHERQSTLDAAQAKVVVTTSNIVARVATVKTRTAAGAVVQCAKSPVEAYLGPEFADAWNELSKEGNAK